jgi:hypothetical protein
MIIQNNVEVQLGGFARKYWKNKGYDTNSTKITVSVFDLSKDSKIKILYCCDVCGTKKKTNYGNISRKQKHLCWNCSRKIYVEHMNNIRMVKYLTGKDHPKWNPNKPEFRKYSYKVRKITEENYTKYKDTINPENLPRTKCGVIGGYQLDHKISVMKGFEENIAPEIIGDIQNLQMLSWKENRNKGVR